MYLPEINSMHRIKKEIQTQDLTFFIEFITAKVPILHTAKIMKSTA
jgi:hypothetical protein